MRAEIIAFGDELIHGVRVNTNSAWLSQRLLELGVEPAFHTSAGDNLADSVQALRVAVERSAIVVCTGGLGPTADDLTREAIAELMDRPLVLDADQMRRLDWIFASRGRTMPPQNARQAMAPQGCEFVHNPHGTAPGLRVQLAGGTWLVALPGVPAEMREMWPEVAEWIQRRTTPAPCIAQRLLNCFGVGESHLEQMIAEFTQRGRNPCVGITAHEATISLRVVANANSAELAQQLAIQTSHALRERLGDLVYGEDDVELADVVMARLRQMGKSLALVEVQTAGILAGWLQRSAASLEVLRGALLFPSPQRAIDGLSMPQGFRQDEGGGIAAADAVRHLFQADVGLALVRGQRTESVGIGIATCHGSEEHRHSLAGHPEIQDPRAAKAALNALRFTAL